LGAQEARDYRDRLRFSGEQFDAIFDTVGGGERRRAFRALRRGGMLVSIAGIPTASSLRHFRIRAPLRWMLRLMSLPTMISAALRRVSYRFYFVRLSGACLERLEGSIAQGTLRPIVERIYPFAESVEALDYVESGHATGKVVVRIRDDRGAGNPG
jgi:NADPH:quinone reductase-like Zn-dependent oxidoreductase